MDRALPPPPEPAAATAAAARGPWALLTATVDAWIDDAAPSMGAALSYYTLFSIAPMLLIVISVAGLVFGEEAARGEIFGQLRGLMGADGAAAVQGLLESLRRPSSGGLGTAIGLVVLLIGATTVFAELQNALDRIWRAPKPAPQAGGLAGLKAVLKQRLLSFGMVLGIGFLLTVSLVLGAVIAALGRWWAPWFGAWATLAQVVNAVLGFAVTLAAFAMIYKFVPRVRIVWRDVAVGALVTSVLFTVGKLAIGLYIGKSGVASGFGAASSVVIVMVWVYYSAQIFLLGAEFTWVWAHRRGSRAPPLTSPRSPSAR